MGDENGSGSRPVWFVGASWRGVEDQTQRFLAEGIWEHGFRKDKLGIRTNVRRMRAGDRIAIKAVFTRREGHPFDTGGRRVSMMRIKAIGTITHNPGNGQQVYVSWEQVLDPPREWRFYTYQPTLWRINPEDRPADERWLSESLIAFAFDGKPQDIERFLDLPYWRDLYPRKGTPDRTEYSIGNILDDGCFLAEEDLQRLLGRLRAKKNLILQGPPGTGKTWLAKRLAFALIGKKDPEKVRTVQFHPSLSYEDFVRGFRPGGDGILKAVDGVFLTAVREAQDTQESQFVVVIEEINRGNPTQIFGELLTLLETDKRTPEEAIELPYADERGDRAVYLPDNLHVIGTMNLADRSLAMVDFALRRRFAFATLEPQIGTRWKDWVVKERGVDGALADDIATRVQHLNDQIRTDRNLGRHFCVGHSFITPAEPLATGATREWFRDVVETEIGPLLQEYWFDDPKKADDATLELVKGW